MLAINNTTSRTVSRRPTKTQRHRNHKRASDSIPIGILYSVDAVPPAASPAAAGTIEEELSSLFIAVYPYKGQKNDEITLIEGTIVRIIKKVDGGWWEGLIRGDEFKGGWQCGWFPCNHVSPYTHSTEDLDERWMAPLTETDLDEFRLQLILRNNELDACNKEVEAYNNNDEKEETLSIRGKTIRKFYTNEKAWVDSLRSFIKEFVKPLSNVVWLPEDDYRTIFHSITLIYDFHKKLLKCLKKADSTCIFDDHFFQVLHEFEEVYTNDFVRNSDILDTLLKYKDVPQLNQFLESTSANSEDAVPPLIQYLCNYLCKPSQRQSILCDSKSPFYLKALTALLEQTPIGHPEFSTLTDAVENMKTMNARIRKTRETIKNNKMKQSLMRCMVKWEGPGLDNFGDLLNHGNLRIATAGKLKERQFYLFELLLIIVGHVVEKSPFGKLLNKSTKDKVEVVEKIELFYASAFDISEAEDPSRLAFKILIQSKDLTSAPTTIKIHAFNCDQKEKWISDINNSAKKANRISSVTFPKEIKEEISSLSSRTKRTSPLKSHWYSSFKRRVTLKKQPIVITTTHEEDDESVTSSDKGLADRMIGSSPTDYSAIFFAESHLRNSGASAPASLPHVVDNIKKVIPESPIRSNSFPTTLDRIAKSNEIPITRRQDTNKDNKHPSAPSIISSSYNSRPNSFAVSVRGRHSWVCFPQPDFYSSSEQHEADHKMYNRNSVPLGTGVWKWFEGISYTDVSSSVKQDPKKDTEKLARPFTSTHQYTRAQVGMKKKKRPLQVSTFSNIRNSFKNFFHKVASPPTSNEVFIRDDEPEIKTRNVQVECVVEENFFAKNEDTKILARESLITKSELLFSSPTSKLSTHDHEVIETNSKGLNLVETELVPIFDKSETDGEIIDPSGTVAKVSLDSESELVRFVISEKSETSPTPLSSSLSMPSPPKSSFIEPPNRISMDKQQPSYSIVEIPKEIEEPLIPLLDQDKITIANQQQKLTAFRLSNIKQVISSISDDTCTDTDVEELHPSSYHIEEKSKSVEPSPLIELEPSKRESAPLVAVETLSDMIDVLVNIGSDEDTKEIEGEDEEEAAVSTEMQDFVCGNPVLENFFS